MRIRLAAAEGSSTTAADGEAPAGTLLRLPSDVVRQVAAFTFAAPTSKSCSIMYDGQKKRRDALEGELDVELAAWLQIALLELLVQLLTVGDRLDFVGLAVNNVHDLDHELICLLNSNATTRG